MKTRVKSLLVSTASAFAVALLAFSLSVGGSGAVRADAPETVSYPGQETVLVPVKDLQALEQRVSYLEETVAALTESWQHINSHRLCVFDEAGATETCISKAQLDALPLTQAPVAQANAPAAVVDEAKPLPAEEPVAVAATEDSSEPAPNATAPQVSQKDSEPELLTGSIAATEHAAEVSPASQIEPLAEGDQP